MTPPPSNILRDHPRKFTLAGVVILICGLATAQVAAVVLGFGLSFIGVACWLDDAGHQAAQRAKWKRFYADLDR